MACSGSVSLSLSVCHRPELTRPDFPLLRATVNLPPATVASGQEVFAGIGACGPAGCPALQISANTGACRLSGSLFSAANETSLRSARSYLIVITLTGDTWTQGVGQLDETGNGPSDQLIRGFTSRQAESFGWNAVVRAGMPQANVQRTTDTVWPSR